MRSLVIVLLVVGCGGTDAQLEVDGGRPVYCGQLGEQCCGGEVNGVVVGVCNCTDVDGGPCIESSCEDGVCVEILPVWDDDAAVDAAPVDAYEVCGTLGSPCCAGAVCYEPYACVDEVCR